MCIRDRKVIKEAVPAPRSLVRDLPVALEAFILWTLAKEIPRRAPDAAAFVRELRAVIAAPEDGARFAAFAGKRALGRRWLGTVLIVVGVALAAVAAWWFFR